MDAQRFGLDLAGQNIANVNTPGYSRRVLDLVEIGPEGPRSAGRGVSVLGVRALRDRLLETRLQHEIPAERRDLALAGALSVVEAALGTPGSSIDANLKNFFDAFARLAEDPASATARQEVVLTAQSLSEGFADMASRLDSARRDADRQLRSGVEDVNSLAGQIAELNRTITAAPTPEAALHLRDRQSQLVRDLSEIIDINVLEQAGGMVDVSIGNGRPLVIGENVYGIAVSSVAPAGLAALSVNGNVITSEITGGKLGGVLQARDVTIPDYQARLDTLAWNVADQVNTRHSTGFTQTGAAAGNLFSYSTAPVGTVGAAAALIVTPAIGADPRLVSAGSLAGGADNLMARSIAALREQKVLNGNTASLSDAWGEIVYRVGRDTKTAKDDSASRAEIVSQVDALRDQVSGVSLDEETMNLLKFQRSYEASARFFSAIDRTIDMLMQNLGR
jgi:flagellar hook-associated protein 1 FlgK